MMRISTSQFYNQNIQTMDSQQSQLSTYYQQLSSGTALTTPADNPLGAAQAVQLTMTSATLTQYQSNQNTALSSLQLEDKTLSSVTSTMTTIVSELTRAGVTYLALEPTDDAAQPFDAVLELKPGGAWQLEPRPA